MEAKHPVFLSVKEIAARLRVSGSVVRGLIRSGTLPAVRVTAHTLRVREDVLEAYLSKAAVAAGEDN